MANEHPTGIVRWLFPYQPPYGNIWGATRCHVPFAPAGTILHQKWGTGDWLWRLICLAKHPTAKHLLLPAMIVPHVHMICFVKKLSVSMLFWPSHNWFIDPHFLTETAIDCMASSPFPRTNPTFMAANTAPFPRGSPADWDPWEGVSSARPAAWQHSMGRIYSCVRLWNKIENTPTRS